MARRRRIFVPGYPLHVIDLLWCWGSSIGWSAALHSIQSPIFRRSWRIRISWWCL